MYIYDSLSSPRASGRYRLLFGIFWGKTAGNAVGELEGFYRVDRHSGSNGGTRDRAPTQCIILL